MKTTVVCSGGLDSVTLAYKVAEEAMLTRLVTFDYGQRHKKEIDFAARCAENLGVVHHVVDLSMLGQHLVGSALTDDVDVPDGHYAEDQMKVTVVPNRNPIMLTIAFGIASAQGDEAVAAAVHGGDHFIYPDCRPGFVDAFAAMEKHALEGLNEITMQAPFVNHDKAEIVRIGAALDVPFADSWSCYKGGEKHCGRCGTCVERREAFDLAGVADPTDYEDPDFWRDAVARRG